MCEETNICVCERDVFEITLIISSHASCVKL